MEQTIPTPIKCSVVVVTHNEERNISNCLRSLIVQDYPKELYEILVVDGCSVDRTQEVVLNMAAEEHEVSIRLVTNPKRTIASNRNIGIQEADFEYVAFTDADCICPPNWLTKLTSGFQQNKDHCNLAAVGGGNRSDENSSRTSQAIGIAFQSYLAGLGTVQTKGPRSVKLVESLAALNVLYRRDRVLSVGGFNERLRNMGEDWDLNFRLRNEGYELLYLPDAEVIHKMRRNWERFAGQMFRYGKGRARLIRLNSKTINWKYLMPLGFIMGMAAFLLGGVLIEPLLFVIPLIYGILIITMALYMSYTRNRSDLFPFVVLAFLLIHFGYGIGEWYGLLSKLEE